MTSKEAIDAQGLVGTLTDSLTYLELPMNALMFGITLTLKQPEYARGLVLAYLDENFDDDLSTSADSEFIEHFMAHHSGGRPHEDCEFKTGLDRGAAHDHDE